VKRKPGRPPLDPAVRLSAAVQVRLAVRHYNALCKHAAQTRVSVPALIRAALEAGNFRSQK